MGRGRGLLIAGAAVALLEGATGVVGVVLIGPVDIALYLLACAGATAVATALTGRLISPRGGHRDDDAGGDGGGGRGPAPEPPWWPGFERDFWRHVRERERSSA